MAFKASDDVIAAMLDDWVHATDYPTSSEDFGFLGADFGFDIITTPSINKLAPTSIPLPGDFEVMERAPTSVLLPGDFEAKERIAALDQQ